MQDLGRHSVLGVNISALDYEAAVDQIASAARELRPLAVSALAVHGLMTGALDKQHRFRLNQFDILAPDGQPVRWALRWLHGVSLPDRVYGPTLMLKTCERAACDGLPIYLFGGTRELLDDLQASLLSRYPNLPIAGAMPSKFRRLRDREERDELVKSIRDSGARITFVGLGCPRQEVWGYEFREAISMPCLAVGAAFNFHAGQLSQAPPTLQRLGLEWLYRLCAEPRRLWRRYLLLNPLYLAMLATQFCHLSRYDSSHDPAPAEEILYG
ncbi:MAG: WecB/TagA/CpsF family glycosyltransferase [Planctomycetales bacterium]|nr:WecB/TagA/CpsF family glycosyltransferase [Planctomycetales bacterium]